MSVEAGRCPSCGAELAPNARSCLACGHVLARTAENGVASIQEQLAAAARAAQVDADNRAPAAGPATGRISGASSAPGSLSVVNQVLLVIVIIALFVTVLLSLPGILASLSAAGLVFGIWLLFAVPSAACCFFLATAKGYHANYAVLWGALGCLLALITYAGLPDRCGRQLRPPERGAPD